MSMQYIIPGVDLEALSCISKSDLDQAIRNGKPNYVAGIGFIIGSVAAPDVVANPELAYCFWMELDDDPPAGVPTGDLKYYNGTSWTPLVIIDGSSIENDSIPLTKLDPTGASALDIIRRNAANLAFEYVSITTAIANGSLSVAKLTPAGLGVFALISNAGVMAYANMTTLAGLFTNNTISPDKLVRGGAIARGRFLWTLPDGTGVSWEQFNCNEQIDAEELEIQRLANTIDSVIAATANQSIRRNASNTGWEWYTPVTTTPVKDYAYMRDQVASGTAPQTAAGYSAWSTKRLNTNTSGSIITSFSGIGAGPPAAATNQFTLIAGNYDIWATLFTNQVDCRLRLRDVTNNVTLLQSGQVRNLNNSGAMMSMAGVFSLGADVVCELQYYIVNQGLGSLADAFGYPMTTGDDEIYTTLLIQQR